MAALITVILAMATSFFALAVAVMRGDFWKDSPHWLPYALFVTSGALYVLAAILGVVHYRRERAAIKGTIPPPPASPQVISQHQEFNPQFNPTFSPQQNLYLGSMSPARQAQQIQDEKSMLKYMQTKHPLQLYQIDKVAGEMGITMPEAKTIMERMAMKGILNKHRINEMMSGVGYMLDEVYRLPDKTDKQS